MGKKASKEQNSHDESSVMPASASRGVDPPSIYHGSKIRSGFSAIEFDEFGRVDGGIS